MSVEIPEKHRVHLAYINGQLNKTAPTDEAYTSPGHVEDIFKQVALSKKRKLTIYIHGGIVSSSDNLFENPFHKNQGSYDLFQQLDSKSYPVFFIWETGVIETIKALIAEGKLKEIFARMASEEITEFLKGFLGSPIDYLLKLGGKYMDLPVFKALNKYVPLALDNANEMGAASVDDVTAFQQMLEQDVELRAHLEEVAQAMAGQDENEMGAAAAELPADAQYYSDEFLQHIDDDYSDNANEMGAVIGDKLLVELFKRTVKALIAIYKEVKRRRGIQRDHDIWPTTIEEALDITKFSRLFAAAWDQMKENARETYEKDNPAVDKIGPRGGRYFINCLADFLLKQPRRADGTIDFDISLVGHSAGSIHLCYFLEAAQEIFKEKGLDNFAFKNMIFLAPAVNIDTFSKYVIPNSHLLQNFRIFTMNDEIEKKDHCAGLFYVHSLLYLVSGSAEYDVNGDKPILGLQRHLDQAKYKSINGNDPNVNTVQGFLGKQKWPKFVVYSVASGNPPGENTASQKHGGFDNDIPTQESILALL